MFIFRQLEWTVVQKWRDIQNMTKNFNQILITKNGVHFCQNGVHLYKNGVNFCQKGVHVRKWCKFLQKNGVHFGKK